MSAIGRRILFAAAAMLVCALLAIIVIGGAAAMLMLLSAAMLVGPLVILVKGPGALGERVRFPRRRGDDRVIDV